MSFVDSIRYRLRVFARSREHERELAEDMKFFVDTEARQREHAARGTLSSAGARDAARRRFGNSTYYREEVRHISGLGFLDTLAQDARFAFRTFARTPAFTAIVVATLAIGIGANAAIFSAVNTLLLTPLPFRAPDRLMSLSLSVPATTYNPTRDNLVWSYPKVEAFRDGQNVFSDLTAWFGVQSTLRIGDDAERISGEFVDQHYFSTLGIVPQLGRTMLPSENTPGAPAVIVISDRLWRSAFNADPSVIGKRLDVDIATFTIIGVAPPRFAGVSGRAQFWMPFLSSPPAWDMKDFLDPQQHFFFVIGRLAPGVAAAHAAAVTRELGPRIDARYPILRPHAPHFGVLARTLDETRVDESDRRTLLLLLSAVAMVLLVACANVASLFLVRAAGRRREIGVRLAIGASRARVVRQLLVESVLLSLAGGAASLVVARIGVSVISAARPALWNTQSSSGIGTVYVDPIHLDVWAFVLTAVIAVATGVLFGLAPAIRATRPDLTESLKTETGTATHTAGARHLSMRNLLTALEIALAVVLLAGSGVLVRSLIKLTGVQLGFEPRNVLTLRINRAAAWSRDSIARFYDVAVDRLQAVPGVTRAAISDCAPQSGGCAGGEMMVLDRDGGAQAMDGGLHWITPNWTEVMRVPLVRGRSIQSTDQKGSPLVAMVSQSTAHQFWPTADPIGRRLVINGGHDTVRVVGVIGDVRFGSVEDVPQPDVYISFYQFPMSFRMMIDLRTSVDPASVSEAARRALHDAAPGFPIYDVATLDTRIGNALGEARFLAQLLSVFAVLALVLATIGAYGVLSYSVAQRTREMGVRIALGATRADVIRLVVGQGAALAVIGAPIGLLGAFFETRLIEAHLYNVAPADPLTLAGIVVVLTLSVLVACWIPARRAASIPAVQALRGG